MTEQLHDLCMAFKAAGGRIVVDMDDLLFDGTSYLTSEYFLDRPESWSRIRIECAGYRQSVELADFVTVTTEALREKASAMGLQAIVVPNTISSGLGKRFAQRAAVGRGGPVKLCYLSGTSTHAADFSLCCDALRDLAHRRSDVEVHIVGRIAFDPAADAAYRAGFISHPRISYESMHSFLDGMDINLAPLAATEFNDAKSELKIFEAALHRVPTIASPTRSYRDAIRHGETGLLATTQNDWRECIERLVDDVPFRHTLGENAFRELVPKHSASVVAARYMQQLRELISGGGK
jgi:glycosyltransferase involved in cell wall biosynthesis